MLLLLLLLPYFAAQTQRITALQVDSLLTGSLLHGP
jgi:hypothetical protein